MSTQHPRTAAALLALAVLTPGPLRAQQYVVPTAQPSCAANDSLLAGARGRTIGKAIDGVIQGERQIEAMGDPTIASNARGIANETIVVRGSRAAGPDSATLQLNVHLVEPHAREITERQGLLVIDDTARILLGTMQEDADPALDFPNGARVWNLYAVIPRGAFLPLARANKIRFEVGRSHADLPRELKDNLRAALAAFVCRP